MHLPELVWTLHSSVLAVLTIFSLKTQRRSKISSDQKRFFIALSLYPLSFFANTPFKSTLNYSLFGHVFIFKGFIIFRNNVSPWDTLWNLNLETTIYIPAFCVQNFARTFFLQKRIWKRYYYYYYSEGTVFSQ